MDRLPVELVGLIAEYLEMHDCLSLRLALKRSGLDDMLFYKMKRYSFVRKAMTVNLPPPTLFPLIWRYSDVEEKSILYCNDLLQGFVEMLIVSGVEISAILRDAICAVVTTGADSHCLMSGRRDSLEPTEILDFERSRVQAFLALWDSEIMLDYFNSVEENYTPILGSFHMCDASVTKRLANHYGLAELERAFDSASKEQAFMFVYACAIAGIVAKSKALDEKVQLGIWRLGAWAHQVATSLRAYWREQFYPDYFSSRKSGKSLWILYPDHEHRGLYYAHDQLEKWRISIGELKQSDAEYAHRRQVPIVTWRDTYSGDESESESESDDGTDPPEIGEPPVEGK